MPSLSGRLRRRFIVNSFGANRDLVNHLHTLVSRFWPGTALQAVSIPDAIEQVVDHLWSDDLVGSIQFWGHGRPGAINVGDEELVVESFAPEHPHYPFLTTLRDRLADNAVVAFKGCQTFAGIDGKNFARGAAAFFGRNVTVLGQSRMLGHNLDWGGAVVLQCGQMPGWPDIDPKNKALKDRSDSLVARVARLIRRTGEVRQEEI